MPTYYYFSPLVLGPGSIVQPGNYGRILSKYASQQGDAWTIARELVLEAVRNSTFKECPSRLASAFVFENWEDAEKSRLHFPTSTLHAIEIIGPESGIHRAAFNLIGLPPPGAPFLPTMADIAHRYWSGEDIEVAEILVQSPLKIIEVLDRLTPFNP